MNEEPLYTSKCTFKSFWQTYSVFATHLEFHTFFGKMVIPFENIEKVEVTESDVAGLLKGDLKLRDFRPALKLDWANFTEHIVLDKSDGMLHRILFTPDNIQEFMDALKGAKGKFQK